MPPQICAKFNCARCKREWLVDVIDGKPLPTMPMVKVELLVEGYDKPEVVELNPLCTTCSATVVQHVNAIDKKMSSVSPVRIKTRAKKEKKGEPAAPPSK